MASIVEEDNGRRRIEFVLGDARPKIRLGKISRKQAEAFKVKVEHLVSGSITGSMDDETSRWVAGLDDKMHARLAALGLVKARQQNKTTLQQLLDAFFGHLNVKPITALGYQPTRAALLD